MPEFDLIELIRARTVHPREDVALGIGDDAALLNPPAGQQLVACTDTMVEGVHFPHGTAPQDLGWKSLAVNLSDLAAMGATPAWAMLALTLPDADAHFVEHFADGFAELARRYRVALIGGDTTQGPLSITLSALGFVPESLALTRSGARAGDVVFVTGTLGDAAAALAWIRESEGRTGTTNRAALRQRLDRPHPRVEAGVALRGIATACIDVSDGLLADLAHICAASNVGVEIDATELPLSSALKQTFAIEQCSAFALSGGDDYELCFTAHETNAPRIADMFSRLECGVARIGRIVTRPGVRVCDASGKALEPPRRGWQHFAS